MGWDPVTLALRGKSPVRGATDPSIVVSCELSVVSSDVPELIFGVGVVRRRNSHVGMNNPVCVSLDEFPMSAGAPRNHTEDILDWGDIRVSSCAFHFSVTVKMCIFFNTYPFVREC